MKSAEKGVLNKSDTFFSTPSPTAKKLYYYPTSAGHFYCTKGYHLTRKNYNSLLISHIIDGTFTFVVDGKEYTANSGETVILDCFDEHEYYTEKSFESIWIHFSGLNCRELYSEITKTEGNIIRSFNSKQIKKMIFKIFNDMSSEDKPSEVVISLDIYKILSELLSPMHFSVKNNESYKENIIYKGNILKVKKYIFDHISEPLTVQDLAAQIPMSPSHFSRVFKSQTGFSPYDFVLVTRLNKAKDMLQKTDIAILQIAYDTGFNSVSNFIYFFSANTGMSPSKFRQMKF